MTTVFRSAYPASIESASTLQELVGNLMQSFLPLAKRNKNHFVNDIPDDLYIDTDRDLVATVLSGMLSTIIKHAKESSICMSAKIYGNVVLVHIKDYNNFNYFSIENNLQKLQPLAEKVGGSVGVTSQRHNVATFAFSFMNIHLAA